MTEHEIFLCALEIDDPARRSEYLDQACAGDEMLRKQVDALIAAHERSGEFLDVPALKQMSGSPQDPTDSGATCAEAAPEPEESELSFLEPTLAPGAIGRLRHYEVRSVIGRGGCGIVLKAFDEKLERMVAIKVMAPELAATSPARKRFLREARATAAIRHENVVNIHAVEEQPLPFLVMEYIDGETLQQRLDRTGPLDVREVLRIGLQIAAGLAAAHSKGLIHRDIKPGNILLENGTDRVRITDFGLARSADDASMTQSGVIAGTPLYMSPEQAQAHEIDFRSDLFSLGSVLYVACSGRPPFRAPSTLAVLKRVIEDQPRPIQSIIPETPDWLAAIIGCLHAKQPAHRFASALELSELLSDCLAEFERQGKVEALAGRLPMPAGATASMLADDSVAELNRREATADAAGHRTARPLRRWAAAAAVLLALLVGLGMGETIGVTDVRGIVVRLFSPVGKFVSEANAPDVSVSVDGTQPLSHEAVVNENTSKPDLHEVIATKGDAARLHERVNTAISDPTTPAAQDAKQGRRTEFASPPAQIVRGDWRMEGAELVQHKIKKGLRSIVLFGDPEWTDYDVSVETLTTAGQEKSEGGDLLFRVQSPDDFYAFSLGGYGGTLNELSFRQKGRWGREAPLKWAAHQTNRWYKVRVEVRGSQMRCWVDDQQQLDWQDSRFAQGRVGLRTWGVNTPVRWKNLKVVSPDGQILLEGFPELGPAAPEPGLIPSPSAALAALRREQIPPSALAFAGNGDPQQAPPSLVAVLGEPEMIQGGNIPSLAFSPDGRWLASASVDGTILLREATTGQTRQRIRGGRFGVSNVAFTPDSQTLVAQADGRIKLWPLGQEAEPSAVLHLDVEWLHMALSPDGRFLAACGADGVVKLWTWGQWDKPRVLPAVGASGWSILAFSADGELLACGWRWGTPKIALYGTRDGALKQTLVPEHGKGVTCLAFSGDGKYLASTDPDRATNVWDPASGEAIERLPRGVSVCFTPDSERLLILGEESHVYDMASRSQAKPVEGRQLAEVRGGRSAALSPDGKTLAIGYGGGAVQFCDAEAWQPKKEYLEAGHRSCVTALSVSPDGQAVYSIGADMTLRRWDLAAVAKPPRTCKLDAADAHLLKCDPQGKSIATGSPKSLTLWDAATTTPLAADSIWPNSLVYSPDGALIALQKHGDNHVCLRDVQLRETCRFTSIKEQAALAFSPDGTLLAAVGAEGAVAIWNAKTGDEAAAWKGEKLSSVAFRPDGRVLALGHADGAISLWDTTAWQQLLAVQAHAGPVLSLSFMPHGKSLVSSGTDGVIQVRNTERERSLTTIPVGMAGPAVAFDLDPSGQFLFASGPTNAIYVHRLTPDD